MSTNDPEVIESLKASCRGIGIVMSKFTTPTILELFDMRGELEETTRLDVNNATTYLRRLHNIRQVSVEHQSVILMDRSPQNRLKSWSGISE